ncbi:hypothetical protein E2N92_04205 [Methanofollis formosanus]|uniref:Yip1 domain-containing protein n=1 Tax=Methanofollis formosanus TaxID=299308 RepID=A0A8G1A1I5_9EURY|nr:YIP1 family protein [Methanofollis formosanus]QYZ78684.1 hypothetical protein E2N92_04205 [Methanofollis formosanus]
MHLKNALQKYPRLIVRALVHPTGIFQQIRQERAGTVLAYGLVIVLFNLIMTVLAAVSGLTPELMLPMAIASVLTVCIGIFWLHLFVYGLGGRNGVGTTCRVAVVGLTPTALLGWIPGVALVGFLWSVLLLYLGLQELQDLSKARAVLALVLVFGLPLLLLALLAAAPGFSVAWASPGRVTWV